MIRRSVFGLGMPSPRRAERTETLHIYGGLHSGIPPQDLPPQFTPDCDNFVPDTDGYIMPRSGLSKPSNYNFNGAVLGAKELFDADGYSVAFAPSAVSMSILHPQNQVWSDLSWVQGTVVSAGSLANLSGSSSQYFNTVPVYDVATEKVLGIVTNDTDWLKFFSLDSSAVSFSDFTWINVINAKTCKDISSVNQRLVLFNVVDSESVRHPARVVWSARGNVKDYLIASGAGFEDLVDMQGSGQAIIRFRDFLLLFTEVEVWKGIPTLDDYAFRFGKIKDSVGCPFPTTITQTPEGVVFLGRDYEVYITDGTQMLPLGPVQGQGTSRIRRKLLNEIRNASRAFGIYNQTSNRFELYYSTSTSASGYPNKALFYSFNNQTWWPQIFTGEYSSAVDSNDGAGAITWDDLPDTWDGLAAFWNSFDAISGNRSVNVFSSDGSTFRYFSSNTDDDGSAFTARWRSKGFQTHPELRQTHLNEVWVDYEIDVPSTASIYVGSSRSGELFDSGTSFSMTSANGPQFVPVWKTSHSPNFELRLKDGGQPRIASFQVRLKDASKF